MLDTDVTKSYDHVTFELVAKGLTKKVFQELLLMLGYENGHK